MGFQIYKAMPSDNREHTSFNWMTTMPSARPRGNNHLQTGPTPGMWYWSMTTTLWGLLLTDSCWAWPFKEEMDRDYDKGRPVDYPEIRKPAAVGVIAIESRIYVASSIKSGDYINHHGHEIVQAAAPRNI